MLPNGVYCKIWRVEFLHREHAQSVEGKQQVTTAG